MLNKYLVLSDIHLGHNVNKTENISKNLKAYLEQDVVQDIEVLFIAGDTFDNCIATYNKDFIIAIDTLVYILNWCYQRNVKLRILEGTPSHDWKQVNVVYKILKELKLEGKIDFKYIDDLCIEHLLGKYILYLPDEYREDASKTWTEVTKLLTTSKLEQVDLCVMHGQFHYQIPFGLKSSHTEEDWLKITKDFIHIGHIHRHSVKDRILAQGSFDRLAHGEEEEKGGILVTNLSKREYVFLVNTNSMLFNSYDLRGKTDTEIMIELNNIKNSVVKDSAVRFIVDSKEHFMNIDKNIKHILSNYRVKIQVHDPLNLKKLVKEEDVLKKEDIESFEIRKDNVIDLLWKEFEVELESNELDTKTISRAIAKLEKLL